MKKSVLLLLFMSLVQYIFAFFYQPFKLERRSNNGLYQQVIESQNRRSNSTLESIQDRLETVNSFIRECKFQEAYDLLGGILNDLNNNNRYFEFNQEIEEVNRLRDYCKQQAKDKENLDKINNYITSAMEYMNSNKFYDAYIKFDMALKSIKYGGYLDVFKDHLDKLNEMKSYCKEKSEVK